MGTKRVEWNPTRSDQRCQLRLGLYGENCSKEYMDKWWLLYFLAEWTDDFFFWFVQGVADLPSEYWQIQRLIKFLKVRVSSLMKQWIREPTDNSKQEKATNKGKQYGIMAWKWRVKKDCWLFHGRTDVGDECWATGSWEGKIPLFGSLPSLSLSWIDN